jgi:hypothetical protein
VSDAPTVKRALRALTTDPPERRPRPRVVADATAALADVRDAAAFVADGGETRLRAVVAAAERRGDVDTVRQGRDALDALARLRETVDADDHFHSARGTVLGGDGQRRDR